MEALVGYRTWSPNAFPGAVELSAKAFYPPNYQWFLFFKFQIFFNASNIADPLPNVFYA